MFLCLLLLGITGHASIGFALFQNGITQLPYTQFVKAIGAVHEVQEGQTLSALNKLTAVECCMACENTHGCKAVKSDGDICRLLESVPEGLKRLDADQQNDRDACWVKTERKQVAVCHLSWEDVDGNCYKRPHNMRARANDASKACADMKPSAHLPKIETKEEAHWLHGNQWPEDPGCMGGCLANTNWGRWYVWTGLNDREQEGTFVWHDGQRGEWIQWHGNEGAQGVQDQEDCTALNREQDPPKYIDAGCENDCHKFHFVCETDERRWAFLRPASLLAIRNWHKLLKVLRDENQETCESFEEQRVVLKLETDEKFISSTFVVLGNLESAKDIDMVTLDGAQNRYRCRVLQELNVRSKVGARLVCQGTAAAKSILIVVGHVGAEFREGGHKMKRSICTIKLEKLE